jgi:succinoglycan biosynthesis protein ExoM
MPAMTRTDPSPESINVCICTFKRASVLVAARSVQKQANIEGIPVRLTIVDNDETDALRDTIALLAHELDLPVHYVHAPAKNISIARNAALDSADTDWLAFIDDDEIADECWLASLAKHRGLADVVVGRSQAIYGAELPDWLSRCDFHSNTITGSPVNAYTSNVLLNLRLVREHEIRFREELGRTGGEDTVFFRQLAIAGAEFVYAPEAVVREPVPHSRADMRWVRRRMYRAGQTHGLACEMFDRAEFAKLWVKTPAKFGFSSLMALATLPGSDRSRKWQARACLHAGAFHYRLRPTILEEYG